MEMEVLTSIYYVNFTICVKSVGIITFNQLICGVCTLRVMIE